MISVLLERVEARLKEKISDSIAPVYTDDYPAKPEELARFTPPAIFLRLNGFGAAGNTDVYKFDVAVLSGRLHDGGIYTLIELAAEALAGYRPLFPGASELTLTECVFSAHESGVWMYTLTGTVAAARK